MGTFLPKIGQVFLRTIWVLNAKPFPIYSNNYDFGPSDTTARIRALVGGNAFQENKK